MKSFNKKICTVIVFLLSLTQIFYGCADNTNPEEKLLLAYVRADSNADSAKNAASEVAAAVDYYLATELDGIGGFDSAYNAVKLRLADIALIATAVLKRMGIGYSVSVNLNDALIIRLGCGYGTEKVSTAYPQSGAEPIGIRYKSLIADALR